MEGSITQLGLSNYLINKDGQTVSFFKHTYKKYTNYVKDTRELGFKNGIQCGQTSSFRFDEDGKYGDLVTNIVIAIDLPDLTPYVNINGEKFGYCNSVGNAIAQNIAFRIGGNLIDEQSSEWMDIYGQLTVKPGCKENYFSMIQKYDDSDFTTTSFTGGRIYIPLQFWFCRNIRASNSALVFPLCAFFNSTIELSLDIRNFRDILVSGDGILEGYPKLDIVSGNLLIDYVTLEEDERQLYIRMNQNQNQNDNNTNTNITTIINEQLPKQMHIINQVQTYKYDVGAGIAEHTFSLKSMRYPVIEIIFIVRRNDEELRNNYFNYNKNSSIYTLTKANPINSVRLIFDGSDRIKTTSASNFTYLEPTKVHTNTPINKFIHIYSFALEPEKIEQPNGLCNFSELQEPLLHLTFNENLVASTLFVFAVNYNVLINSNGSASLLHMLSKSVPTIFPNI